MKLKIKKRTISLFFLISVLLVTLFISLFNIYKRPVSSYLYNNVDLYFTVDLKKVSKNKAWLNFFKTASGFNPNAKSSPFDYIGYLNKLMIVKLKSDSEKPFNTSLKEDSVLICDPGLLYLPLSMLSGNYSVKDGRYLRIKNSMINLNNSNIYVKFQRGLLFASLSRSNLDNYLFGKGIRKNKSLISSYNKNRGTTVYFGKDIYEDYTKSLIAENLLDRGSYIGGTVNYVFSTGKFVIDLNSDLDGNLISYFDSSNVSERPLISILPVSSYYLSNNSFKSAVRNIVSALKKIQDVDYRDAFLTLAGIDLYKVSDFIGNELIIMPTGNNFAVSGKISDINKAQTFLNESGVKITDTNYSIGENNIYLSDKDKTFTMNMSFSPQLNNDILITRETFFYSRQQLTNFGIPFNSYADIDLRYHEKYGLYGKIYILKDVILNILRM